jgi:hypothetical protein
MLTRTISRTVFALVVAGLCVACGNVFRPTVANLSFAQDVCSVHHVPLVAVEGFTSPDGVIVDPGIVEANAVKRYPHFIPSGSSLRRTADHPVPRKLTYCPKCEEAVKAIPGLKRI